MRWRSVGNVLQYTAGGPLYGWPNYGRKVLGDYIAQRGSDTGRFPKPAPAAPRPFQFVADGSVQSNVERARIAAEGYGGVRIVGTQGPRPAAASNLQLGHFFPVAPAEPTGGLAESRRRAASTRDTVGGSGS